MKVFALTFATTLCLVALAQAAVDYRLQCTREEVGIRWPSYHSNSEYYVCQREGGRQMKMSCNPGELFTFVLQSCTSPGKFIPPPSLEVLPTSPPQGTQSQHPSFPIDFGPQEPSLPKPLYPMIDINRPPVFVDGINPPVFEQNNNNIPLPPHIDAEEKSDEIETEEEPPKTPGKPGKPMIPSLNKPNAMKPPMPPTPAPTPAILGVTPASKKQPPVPAGKKQPPVPAGKKQPPVPAGKKQPPAPAKKSPPVPSKKAA